MIPRQDEVCDVSQYWKCFIDESGDLDGGGDMVVLAGYLMPERDDPSMLPRLKKMIRHQAPLVPWPFHRWIATKPAMYPIWREARSDVQLAPKLDAACQQAIEVWEERSAERLKEARRNRDQGDEPGPTLLKSLKRTLKKADYGAFYVLQQHSERICRRISQLPSVISGERRGGESQGLVFMVAHDGRKEKDRKEPYYALLTRLLERLRDVLALMEGEQVVTVEAAGRYAAHPDLPERGRWGRRIPLSREHLVKSCREVTGEPKGERLAPRIRLSAEGVSAYDEEVSAGLVMADGLANSLRRKLFRRPHLADLHRHVQKEFQLPVATGTASLSHLAAMGRPSRALELARAGSFEEAHEELEPMDKRWPREQAEQWLQFFQSDGERQS